MPELVKLTAEHHGDLKVAETCAIDVAKEQHMIGLKVTEVGQAVTNFPVFVTRVTGSSELAVSAITGLELNTNLFVDSGGWNATYTPSGMQTYPFFLMKAPDETGGYTVGIDPHNSAFSKAVGEPLFDEHGNTSLAVTRISAILDEDVKNSIRTYKFTEKLVDLRLLKSISLAVQYRDGNLNTLQGLQTIDEDKLNSLDTNELEVLVKLGYLAPIYAMLISIYQLNSLIARHNLVDKNTPIQKVKIELAKD